ncbi:MAG TPA: hypothetical protein VD963_09585 [Phycisphaerales bacterium]|nr:hypothetical protein [Phycisphaerales bacterium]
MSGDRCGPMARPRASERGFAMPLVVMLALVGGLAVSLVLELTANTALAVRRQTETYAGHHLAVGIKDMTDMWFISAGADVHGKLGEDGLAYEIELPSGPVVRVYLGDGQGSILGSAALLTPAQRERTRLMLARLAVSAPGQLEQVVRADGPVAVSLRAAPDPVLEALVATCVGDDSAGVLAELAALRQRTPLTAEDLAAAIRAANLPPEAAQALQEMLTVSPVLWRIVVESGASRTDARVLERIEGLLMTGPTGLNITEGGSVVIQWEDKTAELEAVGGS